jgi:hypothetical protein
VSASPPQNVYDPATKTYKVVFSPPSVGSGIRAVTYDPDGPAGPDREPPAGDIFAFAPQGIIDAGEAGIAGGRVVIGATQVLNAGNISFSAGSVGVPSAAGAGVSLGSLAGTGGVTENSKMIEQASALGGARDKLAKQSNVVDQFLSVFLDVKVIGFDADTDDQDEVKRGEDQ